MVGIDPCSRTISIGLDALDVPEPHDVLDATELLELPEAHRPALHHGRHDGSVGAQHHLVALRGVRTRPPPTPTRPSPRAVRTIPSKVRDCPGWKNARLRIHESRGRIQVMSSGSRASIEQPTDGIQRGLAPTDDHVPGGRVLDVGRARRPGRSGPRRPRRTAPGRWPAHATPCTSRRRHGCEPSRPSPDRSPGSGSVGRPGSRTSGRSGPAPTPRTGDA